MATERQAYWQGIIDTQTASGLTKAEFFKNNNINPATYYYWFKSKRSVNTPHSHNLSFEIVPF